MSDELISPSEQVGAVKEKKEEGLFAKMKKIIKALRERSGEDKATAGKRFSQSVADELPDVVMPHDALARKQREREMMDEMYKEK